MDWDIDEIDDDPEGSVCPACGDALVEDGVDGLWCPACGTSFS